MGEGYTVGIDLGTTRSAVAYVAGGDPEVIKTGNSGESVIPSVVQFGEDGAVNVGQTAANMAIQHPDRTVTEVKREMGSEEPLSVAGEEYLPEQISSLILEHIVDEAEASIGREVEGAVITVPAYFDDPKRTATESAGEIAGLDVKRLLPEPSAACLAYSTSRNSATPTPSSPSSTISAAAPSTRRSSRSTTRSTASKRCIRRATTASAAATGPSGSSTGWSTASEPTPASISPTTPSSWHAFARRRKARNTACRTSSRRR